MNEDKARPSTSSPGVIESRNWATFPFSHRRTGPRQGGSHQLNEGDDFWRLPQPGEREPMEDQITSRFDTDDGTYRVKSVLHFDHIMQMSSTHESFRSQVLSILRVRHWKPFVTAPLEA